MPCAAHVCGWHAVTVLAWCCEMIVLIECW